jgi:hypothetical protein
MIRKLAMCLALVAVVGSLRGPAMAMTPQEADALFQKQDWAGATKAYEEIVKAEPGNGRAWYRLGVSRHSQGDYAGAAQAYTRCVEIGANPGAMYNLACSLSRQGKVAEASSWLQKASVAGMRVGDLIKTDEDLEAVRQDPGFAALQRDLRRSELPCTEANESRQLDFWVGEWDVRTTAGQLAGTSSVQQILGDCVVFENWTSTGGGAGKSFNFYNKTSGQWQQTWVDDRGGVTEFHGGFKDGAMRFEASGKDAAGKSQVQKLSFTPLPDGSVRQFCEASTDGGVTWATQYDFTYTRRR